MSFSLGVAPCRILIISVSCLTDIYRQGPDSLCTNFEFPPNQRAGLAVRSHKTIKFVSGHFLCYYNIVFLLLRGVNISVLRHEAEFYGITPLGKSVRTFVENTDTG